ncbi:MAG: TolC family protein [Melioribacteraceae bacterium]|nr:TolC family protein [Melioribacteraceae bacterium]
MRHYKIYQVIILMILITTLIFAQENNYSNLTLEKCIQIALEKNKQNEIAQKLIKKSEAQLKQAESARMPQLEISSSAYINDEDINFIQPPLQVKIPPIDLLGMTLSLDKIDFPSQSFKIADNKSILTEAALTYPLYTGGKINSIIEQAKIGLKISKDDFRLSEREIKYNVKNTFYAVILARNISRIAGDALLRFEATYKLTESLFNSGSEKVNKLDYLKNKMTLEAFKGMNSTILSNYKTAVSALKFYMGIDQSEEISISEENPTYETGEAEKFLSNESLNELNINNQKLDNAIKVYESKVNEAQSEYYPSIALFGNFRRWDNSYDYANFTPENQNIFTVGIGLKWSVFNGFRTEGKIEEMEVEVSRFKSQKALLNEGLKMQKEKLLNELKEANEKVNFAKLAMMTAIENRELNLRAYQNEMASVSDFIESQLIEAILSSQHEAALYMQASTIFKIEQLFGDIR